MSKYVCLLGTATSFGFPPMILLSYIVDPCFPPLIGSMVFTTADGKCKSQNLWMTIAVALVDFGIWQNLTFGVMTLVMHIFSMVLNFLLDGTEKIFW